MMKRQKELARQQKQRDKVERRKAAKEGRAGESGETHDEDPDIAGIVPGPQPLDPQDR
jgi:hypothetical protein